jgi:excisionase family DNA binding protein
MTATLEQRTLLPPEQGDSALERLLESLIQQAAPAKLVGPDGAEVTVPAEIYSALVDVVETLSIGMAVTITPHNTLLTTQQAAEILDLSRPTLVRLLTDGEIPYENRGKHRRVRLADLIEYRDRTRVARRKSLTDMTQEAQAMGYYDSTDKFIETRQP